MYSLSIRKIITPLLKGITFICTIFLFINVATAQTNNAVLKTNLHITLSHVPLQRVLQEIEKQTGYGLAYSSDLIKPEKIVNADFGDIQLESLLKELFDDQLKTVRISGKQIFLQLAPQNNKGFISGVVQTSDGKPAAGVSVQLKGKAIGTTTEKDGSYSLQVQEGKYILTVSFTGLHSLSQTIEVEKGKGTNADFTLEEDNNLLQDVLINSERNKYSHHSSDYVAKMPLKNLENPQVYNIVDSSLLADQVITSYADALRVIAGVNMQLENNSAGGTVTARGFSTQSYFRNGVIGIAGSGNIDPSNIERIEAIKGPSGTLYGSSYISYGGLFNIVTKVPFDTFKGSVAYTGGGYDLSRLTADINVPLNVQKTLLFRVNAAVHHEGSWQDAGFSSYTFIAPSLLYKMDEKTSLQIDGEYQDEKSNNFYRLFLDGSDTTGVSTPKDLKIDWKRRFIGDGIAYQSKQTKFFATLTHKFNPHWTSTTHLTYLSGTGTGGSGWLSTFSNNELVSRTLGWDEYYNSYTTNIQENLVGDFNIGKMRNRLLIGLDFNSSKTKASSASITFDTLNLLNPGLQYVALTNETLQAAIKDVPFIQTGDMVTNTYGVYAQDVLNLTDRLIAMASLRWDRYDYKGQKSAITGVFDGGYRQNSVSPRFGLVYQIIKDKFSLFGNYLNGYSNIAPVKQPDGTLSVFNPEHAYQWEGGIKISSGDGKIDGALSYYNIHVNDIVRADIPLRPEYSVQNGSQYSKGIEAQLTLNPVQGLNLIAGYAYNNSKYVKVSKSLDGYRPTAAGPEQLANMWINYRFHQGSLNGLGLSFGGNYASKNKYYYTDHHYALPAYTVLNAAVSYNRKKYSIVCKLDNLSNQFYWVGWGTTNPEMPRRFSTCLTVNF